MVDKHTVLSVVYAAPFCAERVCQSVVVVWKPYILHNKYGYQCNKDDLKLTVKLTNNNVRTHTVTMCLFTSVHRFGYFLKMESGGQIHHCPEDGVTAESSSLYLS